MAAMEISVLVLGCSSNLSYLSYVLSWKCRVVVCLMKEEEEENKARDGPWLLFTLSESPIEFSPALTIFSYLQFLLFIAKNRPKFDYIILGFEAVAALKNTPQEITKMVTEKTVILVDTNNNPWIYLEVDELYDNNPVVSLHSTIDCRLLNKSRISLQLFDIDDLNISIGLVVDSHKQTNHDCLENGQKLRQFQDIYLKFHDCKYSVQLVPSHTNAELMKSIWKGIISLVCFHVPTVVFGNPDTKSLTSSESRFCVVNGIFEEILQIVNHSKISGLPKPFTNSADKLLKYLELAEGFQKMKRGALANNKFFPEFIDSNKFFYDFSQDLPVNINGILLNLLEISHNANINTPYISSIHTVINVLLSIRDNTSKLFQPKKSFNLTQLNVVNNISPTENMMNFPPFNPLPPPTNPLVFVSEFKPDKKNEDEFEVSSVDSSLQELISGTEHLTYGETFEDAKSSLPEPAPPPAPPAPVLPAPQQFPGYPYYPEQPQPGFQHPMYGYPFPYPAPLYPFMMPQPKFPMPRQVPGQYPYFANPGDPTTYNAPPVAKKKTYHPSIPIGKHTNPQYLLQSHTEVLDAVKFDGLMNTTTSSRYGDLDTTTVVLNSANNSRGSKSNSVSLPKPERKHKKDKRRSS